MSAVSAPLAACGLSSRSYLASLGEYEAALSLLQQKYRRLSAARPSERDEAQQEYDQALAHVRALATQVRAHFAA